MYFVNKTVNERIYSRKVDTAQMLIVTLCFNFYVNFQEFRSFWPEKGNPISVDTGNFKLTYREDEEMKKYVIRDFLLESTQVLLDFSLTVKAATLIFISGCGSAISSDKQGKSGFIYNLVKSL